MRRFAVFVMGFLRRGEYLDSHLPMAGRAKSARVHLLSRHENSQMTTELSNGRLV
jgi:hypothetical protein